MLKWAEIEISRIPGKNITEGHGLGKSLVVYYESWIVSRYIEYDFHGGVFQNSSVLLDESLASVKKDFSNV